MPHFISHDLLACFREKWSDPGIRRMIEDDRLAAALDKISAGFAVFNANLRLVVCNSHYSSIRGYPIELCVPGVTLEELFRYNAARGDYGEGDADRQVAERIARVRCGADVTVDQALGDGRILAASYRPLGDGGLVTTYEDVTAMRQAETALRRDQARYEQVTQAVSEGLYDWNIESNHLEVSARLNALFDFAEGELDASDWVARVHPDDFESYRAALRSHLTGATPVLDTEYRIRDKANVWRWVQDRGIATRNGAGRAIRLVGAVSDITMRKNAERALRDSEERYSLAMSAINEGVYDWDVTRDEIFYSPNVREVLGFREEEMKTPKDWIQRIHPEDLPLYRSAWAAHFRGETRRFFCEMRFRHADGSTHWARQHGTGIRDAAGRVVRVVGSTGDITAGKTLERERDEARIRLSVALESMSQGFALFDAEDRLVMCNSRYRRLFSEGADPDIAAMVVPGMRFEDYVRKAFERGMYPDAGSDIEAYIRGRMARRRSSGGGFELQLGDGTWLYVTEQATHDEGLVAVYTDITDVKRREQELQSSRQAAEAALLDLRRAQDRLVQTEKLASLGQLTAGIAHEIKNPLNFVNNFSALAAELTDELNGVLRPVAMGGEVRGEVEELTRLLKDNLEKVVQHGKRADSIVKNMLLHSRQGSGEHRPIDINAIVDESLNLAYHGARAENTAFNITMNRDFDSTAGVAVGYPQEITRALLNLISNGFYAATKRKSEIGEGFVPTLTATTKNLGDKVEIRIRDNGTGIANDILEKIFNPFFTTKPAGEGTGLGLSMSHDIIVKQHGGTIDVDTTAGAFTEFRIVLPRAAAVSNA
jgi:PAS domain S-box-containing protein